MKINLTNTSLIMALSLLLVMVSCVKENTTTQVNTCKITSPKLGQEIVKGEIVIISAETETLSSNIVEVRFFIDGVGKISVVSFPFNYEWITSSETLGNHTLKATSFDNLGVTSSDEITVKLVDGVVGGDAPVAFFSANIVSGSTPLIVTFTDQSFNSPTSWLWDFGDGNSSTEQNPIHTYNLDGSYTVSLIATNSHGSDTLTKSDYIIAGSGGGNSNPCPGMPTVTDADGNTYNTVLLGSQCWMRENLRVGIQINGSDEMTDNTIIEKYCYNDDLANCEKYGGLYQWDEIMHYTEQEGVQGICPSGWHIPSDQDWKYMEMHLGMSQAEADASDWRGEGIGTMLKTTFGWLNEGNGTNTTGFSILPSGYRAAEGGGGFAKVEENGYIWTSTSFSDVQKWYREVNHYAGMVNRTYNYKGSGISVRCLKN